MILLSLALSLSLSFAFFLLFSFSPSLCRTFPIRCKKSQISKNCFSNLTHYCSILLSTFLILRTNFSLSLSLSLSLFTSPLLNEQAVFASWVPEIAELVGQPNKYAGNYHTNNFKKYVFHFV